eukprot:5264343-Alexandrium_andersonii.AAC.1
MQACGRGACKRARRAQRARACAPNVRRQARCAYRLAQPVRGTRSSARSARQPTTMRSGKQPHRARERPKGS